MVGSALNANESLVARGMVKAIVNKPALMSYHTHPDPSGWSLDDLELRLNYRRSALLDAMGARNHIIATAHTKRSLQLPVFAHLDTWIGAKGLEREYEKIGRFTKGNVSEWMTQDEARRRADDEYYRNHARRSLATLNFLEAKSFAVYHANSPQADAKANFPAGLHFQRMTSNLQSKGEFFI